MDNFDLPLSVKTMLCERARRLHHFIWHSVRNSWLQFPTDVQDDLRDKGWEPPRPAMDADGNLIFDNHAGEDFLFMHREMIAHTNSVLSQANDPTYDQVVGWTQVPAPNDADFPVPPTYIIGDPSAPILDAAPFKTDELFTRPANPDGSGGGIQHWDNQLSNPQQLQNMTLGRLGTLLEFTIHNWMHMRWSSDPGSIRPDVRTDNADSIDTQWDALTYDWLGDTYSSHANNHFWKLHGLIDQRIDQWAAANNVQTINWTGDWVGKMPPAPGGGGPAPEAVVGRRNVFAALHALEASAAPAVEAVGGHHNHDHGHSHLEEMESIVRLIQDCGVHYHFYDHDHASTAQPIDCAS